ncbi:hypothetical protein [Streptomyces sp. CL12-4]|uniref:hypothetical protein n=1 Tax=Streptomyces sp. CL12-4 TaxID=2810306 RepID=UPI001EFBCFF1|nr:hypothetical protein [Streptomyces sp. CL12-4]MCG8971464.1 hypothetical protein [Streptomyces sp. CL12-4]
MSPQFTLGGKAVAAEQCKGEVATYVVKPLAGRIYKYVDWNPASATNSLVSEATGMASVPRDSAFFSGGSVIYEVTSGGQLKSYVDKSASGGSLMTAVKSYTSDWTTHRKRLWSNGAQIFSIEDGGKLEVFQQSAPATGDGTIRRDDAATLPVDHPAVVAFTKADDVWAVGATVYTLTSGVIEAWPYAASGSPRFPGKGTVVGTTSADQKQGWAAGPGATRTAPRGVGMSFEPHVIQSYTGASSLTVANSEYGVVIGGEIFAATANCLVDAGAAKPTFGAAADDPEALAAPAEDLPDPPAPGRPEVLKGKFTQGDGKPAAGLPVRIEAIDAVPEDGSEVEMPSLGTTVTGADGSWSLTLPETLPPAVQQAADENGGVVNAMASVTGRTSTGVYMGGLAHVTAAPATATPTAMVLAAADDDAASMPLLPLNTAADTDEPASLADSESDAESTRRAAAYAESWGAKTANASLAPSEEPATPLWQSATGASTTDFNPYLVNGSDTRSLAITPYDGGCDRTKSKVIEKKIYYTTVAEGHAYWDAKASVDYDSKLSSTVEVAAKTGKNWTISGSATLGSAMSVTTGYTNKGPYFAKRWKVPIKYYKYKETWKCGGNNTFTRYVIKPGKYTVPAGGATGTYGADVRSLDGIGYYDSPKANRAYVTAGSYFQLSRNRSMKWSGAVSAFGVGLSGSTQYDRDHKQRITAGERNNSRHYIWGRNGSVSGKPGVFYSY